MKWSEVKWNEVKWSEVNYGEVLGDKSNNYIKLPFWLIEESFLNFPLEFLLHFIRIGSQKQLAIEIIFTRRTSEVKWSEVKWSEVKWSEVNYGEVLGDKSNNYIKVTLY